MDITPMIDVTFLLLIFFIVASRLDPQKAVDLPVAEHGVAVAEKTSVVLIVARGSGDEVLIYAGDAKNPQNLVQGDLADQDQQIEQYVAAQLQADPRKKNVLVMAERGIHYRHVDRVIKAAGRAMDDETLNVATVEEAK